MSKKHLDVVAALIVKDQAILLCQRKDDDEYPNVWEFPGGCIEKDELPFRAIEREIDEELGVTVSAQRFIMKCEDEDDTLHIEVSLYLCTVVAGEPYAKDCKAVGFFDIVSAQALDLGPVDRKILDYLKRYYFSSAT